MKYLEYQREYIPIQLGSMIVGGMADFSAQLIGRPFRTILYSGEVKADRSWWFWAEKDLNEMGGYLLQFCLKPAGLIKRERLHDRLFKEAEESAARVRNARLSRVGFEELGKMYADLALLSSRFHALSMEIDAVDLELEHRLKDQLKKVLGSSAAARAYAALTTARVLSFIGKEELSFLRLVKGRRLASYNKKQIDDFLSRYWWTGLNWRGRGEKNEAIVLRAVLKIQKNSIDLAKKIHILEGYSKRVALAKAAYLKDYQIRRLEKIFEVYARLHDRRKEAQLKTTYSFYLLWQELAARVKVSVLNLEAYLPWEVEALMASQGAIRVTNSELERRRICGTIFIRGRKKIFKSGRMGQKLRRDNAGRGEAVLADIGGVPAMPGKAVGRVVIVGTAKKDNNKVKNGDILVSTMTMPDMFPAMKKAGAIVTDEGGATCHAAIIAREYAIPCVVGTRVATRVLKDGMKVEVNANHGVIKIIKV